MKSLFVLATPLCMYGFWVILGSDVFKKKLPYDLFPEVGETWKVKISKCLDAICSGYLILCSGSIPGSPFHAYLWIRQIFFGMQKCSTSIPISPRLENQAPPQLSEQPPKRTKTSVCVDFRRPKLLKTIQTLLLSSHTTLWWTVVRLTVFDII